MQFWIAGTRTVIEAMQTYSKFSKAKINRLTDAVAERIESRAIAAAPEESGDLKRSIRAMKGRRVRRVVEAAAEYSGWVEWGIGETVRRPPPYRGGSSVAEWAGAKGLPPAGVAIALAKDARAAGKVIEPKPFLKPAAKAEEDGYYADIVRILAKDAPTHTYRTVGKLTIAQALEHRGGLVR